MITARAASFTRRPYGTNRCGSREARPVRAEPPWLSLRDREGCGPELAAYLAGRVLLRVDVDVGAPRLQCVQHRGIDRRLALRTTLARSAQRHDHRTGLSADAAMDVRRDGLTGQATEGQSPGEHRRRSLLRDRDGERAAGPANVALRLRPLLRRAKRRFEARDRRHLVPDLTRRIRLRVHVDVGAVVLDRLE